MPVICIERRICGFCDICVTLNHPTRFFVIVNVSVCSKSNMYPLSSPDNGGAPLRQGDSTHSATCIQLPSFINST